MLVVQRVEYFVRRKHALKLTVLNIFDFIDIFEAVFFNKNCLETLFNCLYARDLKSKVIVIAKIIMNAIQILTKYDDMADISDLDQKFLNFMVLKM